MAWYPTKVIMHLEPVKTGDAKKEMPLVQMAAKVMEETELISMQESVVLEAWRGWEESLRMSNRMRRVGAVALQDESTWEPSIPARRLTKSGRIWKNGRSNF